MFDVSEALSRMNVWVCSYGGSGCNLLSQYLEQKGLVCRTREWHSTLCHYYTYIPTHIPAVYIYADPISALKSQKFRKHIKENIFKLSNGIITTVSDEALIYAMNNQFYSWQSFKDKSYKILYLKYETLWNNLSKLENFLNININDFPPIQQRQSNNVVVIHEKILREKYCNLMNDTSI